MMAGGESEPGDLVFGMHQLDVYMKINNFVRTKVIVFKVYRKR